MTEAEVVCFPWHYIIAEIGSNGKPRRYYAVKSGATDTHLCYITDNIELAEKFERTLAEELVETLNEANAAELMRWKMLPSEVNTTTPARLMACSVEVDITITPLG